MKKLISILLLFCSFVSYSQTSFSDTLISPPALHTWKLILDYDMNFKYFSYSQFDSLGYGKYEINNNVLTLHFQSNNIDSLCLCPVSFNSFKCDSSNGSSLRFNVFDKDSLPLSNATVILKNIGKGISTKINGKAELKHLPAIIDLTIQVKTYEYEDIIFSTNTNSCKEYSIYMCNKKKYSTPFIKHGVKIKYNLSYSAPENASHYLKNRNGSLFLNRILNTK